MIESTSSYYPMSLSFLLAIAFVVGLALLCFTAIAIVTLIVGRGKKGRHSDADEARLMQEIHQGMMKLEKRLEALETIVIEHEKTPPKHHE